MRVLRGQILRLDPVDLLTDVRGAMRGLSTSMACHIVRRVRIVVVCNVNRAVIESVLSLSRDRPLTFLEPAGA